LFQIYQILIPLENLQDHAKFVELAEKYFIEINNTKPKTRKKFKNHATKDLYVYKDINQAHLITGGTTFGYNQEERAVSNVISNILGEGSSSRLFQSLREKNGIAYQINTFMNSFYDISTLGVYLSTNESSFRKAYKLVMNEFEKMKTKKVSQKELKRTKEYIKGHLQMSLESTSNRMMRMGHSLLYYDKIKSINDSIKEIESVSQDEILEYSQILFTPHNVSSVLIASKNLFD